MGTPPPTPDYDAPYPRIGAPDWDRSPDADFRRQVADLLREVEERFRPDGDGEADGGGREPEPSESFDIRAGTPYQLFMLVRLLSRRIARPPLSDLVLLEISRGEGVMPRQLRRRLDVPASTLSELVQRLVDAGLVERRRHPRDRRSRVLTATSTGRRAAAARVDRWRRADEALLEWLTPGERDELRRLLRKGVTALERGGGGARKAQ